MKNIYTIVTFRLHRVYRNGLGGNQGYEVDANSFSVALKKYLP
jgi:hypothetical protein